MAKYSLVLDQPRSKNLPVARSGHRCATDGVFLYCYGGFNPKTTWKLFTRRMWCFHLTSKTWHAVETKSSGHPPSCVASSAMVYHKGLLVVFGGSGYPFGMSNSNEAFMWGRREKVWHNLVQVPGDRIPAKGYGQGAVIGPDDCLYIFGGTKGLVYNNDLHKLNIETCRWEIIECSNRPLARYRHEIVAVKEGFVVIGGYGPNGACPLDKLPLYNYENHCWKEVVCEGDKIYGFPKARRAHTCVKHKNNVYVSGGFDEALPNESHVFKDIWELNVQKFLWTKLPQVLPQPTYFHSAAITSEGCMYIFGGIERTDETQEKRTNAVLKMWLVVPSLKKLCWDWLCDSVPLNNKLDMEKLGQLGVPSYLLLSYNAQFVIGYEEI